MAFPFGRKKEPEKPAPKKYVGLSQKSATGAIINTVTSKAPLEIPKGSLIPSNIFHGLSPYLAVVKSDIKRLLRIDSESRRRAQEHADFMEHHFGGKK